MSEVQFHFHRKPAFAGALLPYRLYVNGQYVGTIHNGKSLCVRVPEADAYYIEDGFVSERNAILYHHGLSEKNIILKRAGGWRTDSYNEFYIDTGDKLEQLPSFHYEKIFNNREIASRDEKILSLCLEFWLCITDDLQEVFASDNIFEIIGALQEIGARQYHDLLSKIIWTDFCDIQFPMNDEQIDLMQNRIEKANKAVWNNKSADDEFHRAIILFIIKRLKRADYIF